MSSFKLLRIAPLQSPSRFVSFRQPSRFRARRVYFNKPNKTKNTKKKQRKKQFRKKKEQIKIPTEMPHAICLTGYYGACGKCSRITSSRVISLQAYAVPLAQFCSQLIVPEDRACLTCSHLKITLTDSKLPTLLARNKRKTESRSARMKFRR